jgi:hypothetical protein
MVAYSGEKCGRIPTKFNPSTPPSSTPAYPRHLVISQRTLLAIFRYWLTREIGWHKNRQETLTFSRGIPKQIARHVIATMFEFGEASQVAAQKREAFLAQSLDCRGVLAARMAADCQALQADELSAHLGTNRSRCREVGARSA